MVDKKQKTNTLKAFVINYLFFPRCGAKMTRKNAGINPKHELITSHACNRLFASNFYGEIPTSLLKKITGHSTEQQFLEYIGKNESDFAIQLADYWSKENLQAKKEPQMQLLKNAN